MSPVLRLSATNLAASVGLLCCTAWGGEEFLSLKSPDNSVQFKVITLEEQKIGYAIKFREKDVIPTSRLGFKVDNSDLTRGSISEKTKSYEVNETYPWRGVHSRDTNR